MDLYRVLNIRELTDSTYVLRFERKNLIFIPGQHICVGMPGEENRPYSIYSGINDNYLEVLVKEVSRGNISRKLKFLKPGEFVSVDQPEGAFTIENERNEKTPFWFISTGTGISPFHSFVRSYPDLNFHVIHGVRYEYETYDRQTYQNGIYFSCTSRDTKGNFNGRITDYLKNSELCISAYYYLCGSYEMIDQIFDLLVSREIKMTQIKTEGYF